MSVADKVVVITGSTRGIGRTMAEYLARAGAQLVVSGRTAEASRETAEYLSSFGGRAVSCPCDVRVPEQVEALRDCALEAFGAIHVWVNNAGITEGLVPVDEQDFDGMRTIVETNLLGTLNGARVILPYLREHGGTLMNLVGRGYRGEPSEFMAVYAATKAAIFSLTQSLAAENKDCPEVAVIALAPGMVETDMHREIEVSDRMKSREHVRHLAMEAFGNALSDVGERSVEILGESPAEQRSGTVYALIGPRRRASGAAKMAWWGMTGRLKPRDGE